MITKSEFVRRAEYTPRPAYCRGDNNIHKKIVLNSLIAEKLLALDVLSKPQYKAPAKLEDYIQGRREQAMRQSYRYEYGMKRVETSDEELKYSFKIASREYKLGFITLPDSHYAYATKQFLDDGASFESIYSRIFGTQELEIKKVSWFDDDDPKIREALYSQSLKKDTVVGPLELSDGKFLIFKVVGWQDNLHLSESAKGTFWDDVISKVKQRKANLLYNEHVANLMRGKSFLLEEAAFRPLVENLSEQYLMKESEKGSMLNETIWELEKQHLSPDNSDAGALHMDQVLFRFDGKDWLIKDFYDLLSRHPLVFRKKRFEMSEFAEQLKFSIADLLKDYIVTGEAYKEGFGDRKETISYGQMWQDQYLSGIYKELFNYSLADSITQSPNSIYFIEAYMNPIIDSLQVKYSDVISINFDLYDDIKLTHIDMFVAEENVPYPVVVPPFPQITTDHVFDYGSKLVLK
ncbi:MAG: hypothetical protein HQ507_06695 [Candidatus Marinimicrobia bacterium]|nr:hypothetical protein [Candidatus Neomarinimicrobiota bacterium]